MVDEPWSDVYVVRYYVSRTWASFNMKKRNRGAVRLDEDNTMTWTSRPLENRMHRTFNEVMKRLPTWFWSSLGNDERPVMLDDTDPNEIASLLASNDHYHDEVAE